MVENDSEIFVAYLSLLFSRHTTKMTTALRIIGMLRLPRRLVCMFSSAAAALIAK